MLESPSPLTWYWWKEEKGLSATYSLYCWLQIWHNMILSSLKDLTWNDKDDLSATYSTLCAWALAEISRNIRAFKRSQDTQSNPHMIEWLSGKGFCNWNFKWGEFLKNLHTSYLSFFLHRQKFWTENFTPKNALITANGFRDKIA